MAFRSLCLLSLALAAAEVHDTPASDWCAWIPMRALEYVKDCTGNRTNTSQAPAAAVLLLRSFV